MSRWLLVGVAIALLPSTTQAAIDCRIRSLPPESYASKPLPPVKYKGLPLADLQKLYRRMAGLPARAAGLSYCAGPLGFVYPWRHETTPTIYFPTDVTERCRREVIEHEEAHVKGWPLDHPSARTQTGPCKAKPSWPRTIVAG